MVRASTFVAQVRKLKPQDVSIPAIGGHSGVTIVPLLSHAPGSALSEAEAAELTRRIQYGGDEVVRAKDGAGSATLSMAYAAREFIRPLLRVLSGHDKEATLTCFTRDSSWGKVEYLAAPVLFNSAGKVRVHPLPSMSRYEASLYEVAIAELEKDIAKGASFARGK